MNLKLKRNTLIFKIPSIGVVCLLITLLFRVNQNKLTKKKQTFVVLNIGIIVNLFKRTQLTKNQIIHCIRMVSLLVVFSSTKLKLVISFLSVSTTLFCVYKVFQPTIFPSTFLLHDICSGLSFLFTWGTRCNKKIDLIVD